MFSAGILLVQLLQASVTEASLWPFKNSHSQLQGHTIHASILKKPQAGHLEIAQGPFSYPTGAPSPHIYALELFHSLESKSTCHGEAAASLMTDCVSLKSDTLDEGVRISYAVRLAICEFKSTGIAYPSECKKVEDTVHSISTASLSLWGNCIKKLEEKPQHWTTLSNNIQNALALCSAARHEIEKDELLSLHKNITKVQQSLFNTVQIQLNEAWTAIQAKREWESELKESQKEVIYALNDVKEKAVNALENSNIRVFNIFGELSKQLQYAQESSQDLSYELKESVKSLTEGIAGILLKFPNAWRQMEDSHRGASDEQMKSLREASKLANNIQTSLSLTQDITSVSLNNIKSSIREFSEDLAEMHGILNSVQLASMAISESFIILSSSYQNLVSTQSEFTDSLQLQQTLHERMLSSIERAHGNAGESMGSLLEAMGILKETVDAVEGKVQGFWSWKLPVARERLLMISALMIFVSLLTAKGGASMTWSLSLFSGFWALVMAANLVAVPESPRMNPFSTEGDALLLLSSTKVSEDIVNIPSFNSKYVGTTWIAWLGFAIMTTMSLYFWWNRSRSPNSRNKFSELHRDECRLTRIDYQSAAMERLMRSIDNIYVF